MGNVMTRQQQIIQVEKKKKKKRALKDQILRIASADLGRCNMDRRSPKKAEANFKLAEQWG